MLERLVAFALSQRMFVALSVLLLIGAGVVVLPSLPIDAFPDVSPVQVKVIMKAPGLTPEEVEQRITVPIELELLGIAQQEDPSLDDKIRARRHHRRFRGRHRHLLGAQPGFGTAVQYRARSSGRRDRRPRSDHEPARRNVHVHDRQSRSLAGRAAKPARLGNPPGAADRSGGRRRQLARRSCPGLRDRAVQRCPRGTRHFLRPFPAGDRDQQPQRRRRPRQPGRGQRARPHRGQHPLDRRHQGHRGRHKGRHSDPGQRSCPRPGRFADALWRRHASTVAARRSRDSCLACAAPMPASSYATSASACRSCSLRCRRAFPSTCSTTAAGWSAAPSEPWSGRWPKPRFWSSCCCYCFSATGAPRW